jgi:hypothetical protein
MIGTEALGKWLAAPSMVEHTAGADAVDVRRFNTESDYPTRKDIHDDHYPEALQQDGLAAK